MITERDVVAALPPEGFVRTYVIHALKQTTSPLCYHLGVGLSLLAVTCPENYGTTYAGPLRSNLFTLLVGRSGEDQKSSAINIGRSLLDEACPGRIGDFPGSPEGLIDSLQGASTQLIPMSEFGRFLSSAQKGYFEPIKTLMADLWDCHPVQRAKANGKHIRVESPRLNVMAACSIPYLERHTLSEDWTGGFMGRWAVMYGRRERIDPFPSGDDTHTPHLIREIERMVETTEAGWCNGLDPEAKKLWSNWYHDLYKRRMPSMVIGLRSRAPTIALKTALLYGWDFGPARLNRRWFISRDELVPAIKFAELHIKSLIALSEKIADHPDARLRRQVLLALEEYRGEATLGQILTKLKMRKRPVQESLDALLEEGKVLKTAIPRSTGYAYVLQGDVGEA